MTHEEALMKAKKIVRKSRHTSISATGEKYEPRKKLIENLHKNITQALLDAEKNQREKDAKISDRWQCPECDNVVGDFIAEAIRKGE